MHCRKWRLSGSIVSFRLATHASSNSQDLRTLSSRFRYFCFTDTRSREVIPHGIKNQVSGSSEGVMVSRLFDATVLPHLDAAFNYARWLTRNDAEAEDVVQDACVRALRYFSSLRGDDARAWLFAIVRNTYLSRAARRPIVSST